MKGKIYHLQEVKGVGLVAFIHEGVTSLEEHPFLPSQFEYNDQVQAVHLPCSLTACYMKFQNYFPNAKKVGTPKDHPLRGKFRFDYEGYLCSPELPRELPPYCTENEDGTLTLAIPEGVRILKEFSSWWLNSVTRLLLPASLEEFCAKDLRLFSNLKEIQVHPDSPYLRQEGKAIFSKDKKTMLLFWNPEKTCAEYRIEDCVEEIGPDCFSVAGHLSRIIFGKGVKKIGQNSLSDDVTDFSKIYIPATVTELAENIFGLIYYDEDMGYNIGYVGGTKGSAIETYCHLRDISFVPLNEDEVETFYATPVETLLQQEAQRWKAETTFTAEDSEGGYRLDFADGVLTVTGLEEATTVSLENIRQHLHKGRRDNVTQLVIGPRMTHFPPDPFDDCYYLECVHIGKDTVSIDPYTSCGCGELAAIRVDSENPQYKSVDGVLYTRDGQTLIKYPPNKPDLYFKVGSEVRCVGKGAFAGLRHLECLEISEGCTTIEDCALGDVSSLCHLYCPASVTQWSEYTLMYSSDLVVGGPEGCATHQFCIAKKVCFYPLKDDEIAAFMAAPLPWGVEDPYRAAFYQYISPDDNHNELPF